jgi:hypothetical protein
MNNLFMKGNKAWVWEDSFRIEEKTSHIHLR